VEILSKRCQKTLIVLSLLLTTAAVGACDEVRDIEFVNQTLDTITVEYAIDKEASPGLFPEADLVIGPGETAHVHGIVYGGQRFRIRVSVRGKTILDKVYAYTDLKNAGFRLEINGVSSPTLPIPPGKMPREPEASRKSGPPPYVVSTRSGLPGKTMLPAARKARAWMVSVGLYPDEVGKTLPSAQ
jgi:hypothetical protein